MGSRDGLAITAAWIGDVLGSLDQQAPPETTSALVAFSELFLTWNAKINLGGMRTTNEFVERHLRDAFAAARFLGPTDRVIDVGSGGGLPSVPLALVKPGACFDLFEPIAKKVAFLRTAVRQLGLGDRVRIHSSRVDAPLSDEIRGVFDVALSRATIAPAAWIPLGLGLVREGGRVLVFATQEPVLRYPVPAQEFGYAPNRRILVFRR